MKMHRKSSSEDQEVGGINHVTKNGLACEIMILNHICTALA